MNRGYFWVRNGCPSIFMLKLLLHSVRAISVKRVQLSQGADSFWSWVLKCKVRNDECFLVNPVFHSTVFGDKCSQYCNVQPNSEAISPIIHSVPYWSIIEIKRAKEKKKKKIPKLTDMETWIKFWNGTTCQATFWHPLLFKRYMIVLWKVDK